MKMIMICGIEGGGEGGKEGGREGLVGVRSISGFTLLFFIWVLSSLARRRSVV